MGFRPGLVQYGLDDVVLDLPFDAVGAVVVAIWTEVSGDGAERVTSAISRRLLGD